MESREMNSKQMAMGEEQEQWKRLRIWRDLLDKLYDCVCPSACFFHSYFFYII